MTTVARTPLPPLQVRFPLCPIDGEEVGCDGESLWCETCGGVWPLTGGADGEANLLVEQCPAEVEPYRGREDLNIIVEYRYRCVRDVGHPTTGVEWHVGVRSNGPDVLGEPFEWCEGQYPQVTAAASP